MQVVPIKEGDICISGEAEKHELFLLFYFVHGIEWDGNAGETAEAGLSHGIALRGVFFQLRVLWFYLNS
ncbi:hypothetical protein V3C99_008896 [Haemonchus contortus]